MQEVSATYTSLLSSTHSVESKLEVWDKDGENLIHTFNEQEISSMSTTRGLFANDTPSVGGTVSCEIDCDLYVDNVTIPRMAMLKPYVRLSGEKIQYVWERSRLAAVSGELITYTLPTTTANPGDTISSITYSNKIEARNDGTPKLPSLTAHERISYDNVDMLNSIVSRPCYGIIAEIGNIILIPAHFEAISLYGRYGVSVQYRIVESLRKDQRISDVTSFDRNAYPDNMPIGEYWYEYSGEEQIVATSEWLPKGVYWIDTRSTDYSSGKMTIHGYDAMLKGEVIFANETTVEDWSRTDLQVLNGYYDGTTLVHNGIAQKLGVSIQQDTLDMIDRGYIIQFPGTVQGDDENVKGAAYTVREVLSFLGAAYCGNWTIDEDGTLRLVKLNSADIETYYLVDENADAITFGGTKILVG